MLCPDLVTVENDRKKKKSRFVIKYINFNNEDIPIECGKTVGHVQPCIKEKWRHVYMI